MYREVTGDAVHKVTTSEKLQNCLRYPCVEISGRSICYGVNQHELQSGKGVTRSRVSLGALDQVVESS